MKNKKELMEQLEKADLGFSINFTNETIKLISHDIDNEDLKIIQELGFVYIDSSFIIYYDE